MNFLTILNCRNIIFEKSGRKSISQMTILQVGIYIRYSSWFSSCGKRARKFNSGLLLLFSSPLS